MKTTLIILGFFTIGFIHQCQNTYPPVVDGDKEIAEIKAELEIAKAETNRKIDSVIVITEKLDSIVENQTNKQLNSNTKRIRKLETQLKQAPIQKPKEKKKSFFHGWFGMNN